MNWLRSHKRSAWICGLTLFVLFLVFTNALLGLWQLRQQYASDIDHLVPRIARMQGLIGYENQLRDASSKASKEIEKLVYPASTDRATASAALQTSVRQILSDAGLSISNSQVLPVVEKDNFDYIGIRLTVEGSLSGLDTALTDIAEFKPLLLVESLDMSAVRSGRRNADNQTVSATLQVLSLRALL